MPILLVAAVVLLAVGVAESLAAGAVVLGYSLAHVVGLGRRVRAHRWPG